MQNQNHTVFGNNGKQSNWKIGTRGLAIVGILIAMNLALSRVGIMTPIVRITFAFLPIALIGMLFGPFIAGVAAALADILAFMLAGGSGTLFPGFTLSALLTGVAYGLFLHRKDIRLWQVIMVEVIIAGFIHIALNTVWVMILTENPLAVVLPPRLVQNALTLVIRVVSVWFIANNKQLKNVYRKFSTAKK